MAAAVTEGVVSFGVQKLWELLSRESERLQGVDEQVAGLKRHTRTLQSLLNDAYAKKYESERVRNLLEDVKDIVDDAEDIIESFLLKEIKEKGIKKRVKRLSCFLVDRRRFATDIEGITERISEVIARMQNFGIIQKIDGGRSLSLQERQRVQREFRQTFPKSSEKGFLDSNTKLELGNLVNLETLWHFPTKQGNVTDLLGMTRLRTLSVFSDRNCTSETLQSSLRELRNLETFYLVDRNLATHGGAYQVDFVGDFIHLRDLTLFVHMPRFPDQSRFPPNLANISLSDCRIEEDPLPILEKLLHLKSAELSYHAFVGRRMVCSKGGFPQLCELILELDELEEWVVEEGSMPCLRTLTIDCCKKLKEVPDGLKYITSLKKLVITGMKGWKKKLVPGGESYYKVQHIPEVEFEYCDDDE
ncbi:unnamed protein product [Arabis nemorensis]|uniref:Uncharacterized protein n=1 Tax=Arabis nemorensis TaxID=586526 RepID=A0A565C0M3_9BRAS|nr:unnamed protein product [Arabis nemorensis]